MKFSILAYGAEQEIQKNLIRSKELRCSLTWQISSTFSYSFPVALYFVMHSVRFRDSKCWAAKPNGHSNILDAAYRPSFEGKFAVGFPTKGLLCVTMLWQSILYRRSKKVSEVFRHFEIGARVFSDTYSVAETYYLQNTPVYLMTGLEPNPKRTIINLTDSQTAIGILYSMSTFYKLVG